jgi:hypothetical protein
MKLIQFIITFILLIASTQSFAVYGQAKKKILISVGDIKNNNDKLWKKSTCDNLFKLAEQIVDEGADVVCRSFNTDAFFDKDFATMRNRFDYHMRVTRNQDSTISMDVSKIHRDHETDFHTLGWTFKDGENSKITKEEAMAKAASNFFFYATNEKAFQAGLLVNGVQESDEVAYDQNKGLFIDKLTNEPISIDRAYKRFEGESERKKNYLRAGVEIGVLLSSAMAIYYKNLVFNQVDFDYTFKEGIRKKLSGEAIRFDDNDKSSNYGHVYAGVMYYQMARSNGLNSLESFLVSFASSTTWEFMEYHEVLSINDEILTPIGGYVIGEATYQISCALFQKNNLAAKALGYTINPGMAANHSIDKFKSGDKFAGQPDCKKPRWSDISLFVGLDKGQKPYSPTKESDAIYGMNATVVNIADYQEEGQSSKLVYDTAMTKMLVEVNGNEGFKDLRVVAEVVAAAYHQKNLGRDEKGQLRGYDLILGIGSGTEWNDRGTPYKTKDEDFYGTINVLGASAHANIHYNGFNIKADFAFYGDFAMVKSYSLNKFAATNPNGLAGQATTIKDKGYYWGMGTTTLAAIAVSKGRFEVGINGQFSNATSIKGHHRLEETITTDDQFKDSLNMKRVYVSYQLSKSLKIQLAREYYTREGVVNGDTMNQGTETRTTSTLMYQF